MHPGPVPTATPDELVLELDTPTLMRGIVAARKYLLQQPSVTPLRLASLLQYLLLGGFATLLALHGVEDGNRLQQALFLCGAATLVSFAHFNLIAQRRLHHSLKALLTPHSGRYTLRLVDDILHIDGPAQQLAIRADHPLHSWREGDVWHLLSGQTLIPVPLNPASEAWLARWQQWRQR